MSLKKIRVQRKIDLIRNKIDLYMINDKHFMFITPFSQRAVLDTDNYIFLEKYFKDRSTINNYDDKFIGNIENILDIVNRADKRFNKHRKLIKKKSLPNHTIKFALNSTTLCNLQCRYCFRDTEYTREKPDYERTEALFREIIRHSADYRKVFIGFNMLGEPLIDFEAYKKLLGIARKYESEYKKEIQFSFLTNGYLLNREKVDWLYENKGIFGISIDGGKLYQDLLRVDSAGRGFYESLSGTIRYIFSKNWDFFPPGASVTLTSVNIDVTMILRELFDLGFRTIVMKPVRLSEEHELALSAPADLLSNYKKLADFIIGDAKFGSFEYLKTILNEFDYFGRFIIKLLMGSFISYRCKGGSSSFSVLPDGSLYPCDSLSGNKHYVQGNIYDKKIRQRKIAYNVDKSPICSKCAYRYVCGGGCVHNMLVNNSTKRGIVEAECELNKGLIRLARYLLDNIYLINPEILKTMSEHIMSMSTNQIKED